MNIRVSNNNSFEPSKSFKLNFYISKCSTYRQSTRLNSYWKINSSFRSSFIQTSSILNYPVKFFWNIWLMILSKDFCIFPIVKRSKASWIACMGNIHHIIDHKSDYCTGSWLINHEGFRLNFKNYLKKSFFCSLKTWNYSNLRLLRKALMPYDLRLTNLQINGDCLTKSQRMRNPHAHRKFRKNDNQARALFICLKVC